MEKYDQYQKIKSRAEIPVEKLKLNAVPERLWQYISVNFITKLLVFKDYDSILVVYDMFLKILYFIVIIEIIAERLVKLFKDNVWKLHRLSKSMISDKDLQFVARLIKKLNKKLKIEMKLLTAFYL